MPTVPKILTAVLSGRSDANTRFSDLRRLLGNFGFDERVKGDHFIYSRSDVIEILNLQPLPGRKAKPYQVKQVRQVVVKYGLQLRRRP
ncbi:MAG TPA: hypothetical protein VGN72_14160 [Tepidisphaeraceae bacterium]|jgi:hypothetical protein|nr:hypothetical protein [Tepidisphaeraceae bacterium]